MQQSPPPAAEHVQSPDTALSAYQCHCTSSQSISQPVSQSGAHTQSHTHAQATASHTARGGGAPRAAATQHAASASQSVSQSVGQSVVSVPDLTNPAATPSARLVCETHPHQPYLAAGTAGGPSSLCSATNSSNNNNSSPAEGQHPHSSNTHNCQGHTEWGVVAAALLLRHQPASAGTHAHTCRTARHVPPNAFAVSG